MVKGELDCPVNLDSDCKRESTADTGLPNWCAKNLKYCTNRIWQYSQMEPKSFWKRQISIFSYILKSEVKSVQLTTLFHSKKIVSLWLYYRFFGKFLYQIANSYIICKFVMPKTLKCDILSQFFIGIFIKMLDFFHGFTS